MEGEFNESAWKSSAALLITRVGRGTCEGRWILKYDYPVITPHLPTILKRIEEKHPFS